MRPACPGKNAVTLCQTYIDNISHTSDAQEFITAVVEETANDCLAIVGRKT